MKRTAHYLNTVKGGLIPRQFVCLATETLDDGGVYWAVRHIDLDNQEDAYLDGMHGADVRVLWTCLREHVRSGASSWLMLLDAVNVLGELGFWDLLEECKWEITEHDERDTREVSVDSKAGWRGFAVLQDPPAIICCRPSRQKRTIKILDLRNYGVSGWQSICSGDARTAQRGEQAVARANGAYIFMRQLVSVVQASRLGSLKTTAASQAMHAYRHRFLNNMVLSHANTVALGVERAAMYAGRCEAWTVKRKVERVYHLDFNAFYPSVVCGELMPARLVKTIIGVKPHPEELMRQGYLCISEVTVNAGEPLYPYRWNQAARGVLDSNVSEGCFRHLPRNGDTVYPTGTFTTTLCGPELRTAIRRQEVKRVWYTAVYEPAELFTQWSTELAILEAWAKDKASKGIVEFVKRLRNSLFGKFGQWGWSWQDAPWEAASMPFGTWYGKHPKTGESVRYRSIGWTVQAEEKTGETHESCPAISAWVYSLARSALWRCIRIAGTDNVHYMDSDSLWVNHDGFRALDDAGVVDQSAPGKLKLCGMHEWAVFHGMKQYETSKTCVHAGVPDKVPGSFARGWRYQSREKLMPALLNERQPGTRDVTNVVTVTAGYRHGVVTVGGRVMPHHLREE